MVRVPTVILEKDGNPILGYFLEEKLVSLTYIDDIDDKVDGLTMVFSKFFIPPKEGDKIKLYLGYDGMVEDMGEFYPIGVREDYGSFTMEVKLTPVDFSKPIKQKRTKSYKDIKLSALVAKVAGRNGLKSKVTVEDITIKSKQQSGQSDIAFLKSIAQEYNATFAIKSSTVILAPKASSKDRDKLPKISLTLADMIELEIEYSYKSKYKSAEAKYRDTEKNKDITVKVGGEEPKLVVEGSFKSDADAKAKVQAKLDKANGGTVEGSFSTTASVTAGAMLTLVLPDRTIEHLQIKQVQHTVSSSGYIKQVKFTK